MEILLENVRCFTRAHQLELRPITLVIGENSSGKSTLLATIGAATGSYRFPSSPAFNEPPFQLGNYENIATYKGGKYGRASFFRIGLKTEQRKHWFNVVGTYRNDRGNPTISNLSAESDLGSADIKFESDAIHISATTPNKDGAGSTTIQHTVPNDRKKNLPAEALFNFAFRAVRDMASKNENKQFNDEAFYELFDSLLYQRQKTEALAPLRTKPRRTYDQVMDQFSPDGDHIPYVLARLFEDAKTDSVARTTLDALLRFGKASGMFEDLEVKKLGKHVSDPFQILVTVFRKPANLVDVGYGVSQSLPIVVQSILSSRSEFILLQQPEVHLHPRAQAAIGTFFCEIAGKHQKKFIIETHSDFIVDRTRLAVAEKVLKPEDVVMYFLERTGHSTKIHKLTVDAVGNLEGAPQGYRSFFMREEMKLLGHTQ